MAFEVRRVPSPLTYESEATVPALTMRADAATGIMELAVHGRWNVRLGTQICDGIRQCLTAGPPSVLVDLHDLGDPDAASVPLWLAARRAAAVKRPPVRFALCLPPATAVDVRLRRLGAQHLPLYATMADAREALTSRHHALSPLDPAAASPPVPFG